MKMCFVAQSDRFAGKEDWRIADIRISIIPPFALTQQIKPKLLVQRKSDEESGRMCLQDGNSDEMKSQFTCMETGSATSDQSHRVSRGVDWRSTYTHGVPRNHHKRTEHNTKEHDGTAPTKNNTVRVTDKRQEHNCSQEVHNQTSRDAWHNDDVLHLCSTCVVLPRTVLVRGELPSVAGQWSSHCGALYGWRLFGTRLHGFLPDQCTSTTGFAVS